MRTFLKNFLIVAAILGVSGALLMNFLLGRIARSVDFKRFAEKKGIKYQTFVSTVLDTYAKHL